MKLDITIKDIKKYATDEEIKILKENFDLDEERDYLEVLIDQNGLSNLLIKIADICQDKIDIYWKDESKSNMWQDISNEIINLVKKLKRI